METDRVKAGREGGVRGDPCHLLGSGANIQCGAMGGVGSPLCLSSHLRPQAG